MKSNHRFLLLLALVLGFLALLPLESLAYEKLQVTETKEKKEVRGAFKDTISEVGTLPMPLPSRLRVVIDAGKGVVCLQCHRIPYPNIPKNPDGSKDPALSSIQITAPGGWRLLTSLPYPFNKRAGGWSPDGKQLAYSINLFQNDWDIWVMDADGKNRRPLLSGPTIDMAPDWSRDGKSILFQSNRSGNNDIWMMEIASKKLTQLTQDPGQEILPKWSPDGKRIVFQSNRSGDEEIWVMEIANGQWTQLTNSPAKDENPVFSPSGDQILFVSDRNGNRDIFIMNLDGTGQKALTKAPEDDMSPNWTPDGKKVIFARKRGDNLDLWVMNPDGTEQIRLTTHPAAEMDPHWSPDGGWITFSSNIRGTWDVLLMQVDASMIDPGNSPLKRLTDSEAREVGATWSPDGKKIAYNSDVKGHWSIWVMEADGSNKQQLTGKGEDAGWPIWSPDGSKILYWCCKNGNEDVWVMDADGSNKKRLTDHPALDGEGEWSPDGKRIVFVSERTGNGDLYLMDADGSNLKRLTFNEKGLDWTPHWSPDGKKIAYISDDTPTGILEIWTMNLETGEKRHLSPDGQDNVVPQWRPPEGRQILYQGWRGGKYAALQGSYDLVIMNPDASEKRDLIPSPVQEMSGRWSPDGERILFWSWRTGNPEIFIASPDGSGLTQLTDNLAYDVFPSFSPDGKKIAFDSDRMGNFDIWVMEVPR